MSSFKFTDKEREIINDIGQLIMPPGRIMPPFTREVIQRMEDFLKGAKPGVHKYFQTLIWMFENGSRTRYLRSFTNLPHQKKMKYLQSWTDGAYLKRTMFRGISSLAQIMYYNDSGIFEQMGIETIKPPIKDEPKKYLQQMLKGQEIQEDMNLEAEVVVIGTGAGGAVVASELAEKGNAVVMIEEGDYHDRTEFTGRPLEMQRKLYHNSGLFFTVGNASIVLPTGKTVGGTTTVNSGTCFRTPRRVLRKWREEYGLGELTPKNMEPYFKRVEEIYQVQTADMKYVGPQGEIIARGAEKLGYSHAPLPRCAPDCDGKSVCCFGCPTDAKRSTNISYVPRALQNSAYLVSGTRMRKILTKAGKAIGVECYSNSTGKKVTVKAPIVILAGGTLQTPMMLMNHKIGNSSGQLGRNISIHPAAGLSAIVDDYIESWKLIPQGYMVNEFEPEGIMLEGISTPIEMTSVISNQIGADLQEFMENYHHLATFGFMIKDSSRGRIRPGIGGKPMLTYLMNDKDKKQMLKAIEIIVKIYLAADARKIYTPVFGWGAIRSQAELMNYLEKKVAARDIDMSAYHPLGSCHMGAGSHKYVCDQFGEVYDMHNLFVCDGSMVPPALGVNPQITISALATRIADYVSERLSTISMI